MGDQSGDEVEVDRAKRLCFALAQLRDDLSEIVTGLKSGSIQSPSSAQLPT